jgi:intracellular multiplication protein IcmN
VKRVANGVPSIFIGSVIVSLLLLTGCHRYYIPIKPDDNVYKMPRRVPGSSDAYVDRMVKKFNRGNAVKVISIGSDYLISMPSDSLFANQSPRLIWSAYPVLNRVVRFCQEFRKVAITITCYTSQYVSDRREHALALARARALGDYLWSQGVDTRFIFTQGAGADKPVTNYIQGGDHSPSSRIEISFRDVVA